MLPVSRIRRNRRGIRQIKAGLVSTASVLVFALLAEGQSVAQPAPTPEPDRLPQVDVTAPPTRQRQTAQPSRPAPAPRPLRQARRPPQPAPTTVPVPAQFLGVPLTSGLDGRQTSPLNGSTVTQVGTLLGIPAREVPASVDVVSQEYMREQGYRTTAEAAYGAPGVQAIDVAGAPANFMMRGLSFGEVNVLYNGISIGPANITSRWMDTANLAQVEFLKGPSSLMTGLNAIGGSVNYVSRQPHTGAIRNEVDLSVDSLGTIRSHFGSGGTLAPNLDYRFDLLQSGQKGYIDDIHRDLTGIATQFNYRASDVFTWFGAIDYKRDDGTAYWGTPLVPATFAGPFAKGGVVSGSAISTFSGALIDNVTFDRRLEKINYNTLDNRSKAEELWLRTGFAWALADNATLKDQAYYYQAKRSWLDAETYSFDDGSSIAPNTINRDRFFVGHKQNVIGNNLDFIYAAPVFGMDNRFAAQLHADRNKITFTQHAGGFPEDTVDPFNPDRGFYGVLEPDTINKTLSSVALSFEDRLKITPWLAFMGGVRFEHLSLDSSRVNFDGGIPPANNFSKSWDPISYRAAVMVEPIRNLMYYAMTASAYDPAAAGIFSVANRPTSSLELSKATLYEAGVKYLTPDNRAEFTFAAYDLTRTNVFVLITNNSGTTAGEIKSRGVEMAVAWRPIDGLKLWGNVGAVSAHFNEFIFNGNEPSNVAPIIVNGGASYRWANWRYPVELGGSVRHVDRRFLAEDNLTRMEPYTTADLYAFVDVPGREWDRPDTNLRIGFRVRNVTDTVYAAYSDSGYPDQFYLGAPRTYEVSASLRF